MNKKYWKAVLSRAAHAVWENLVSTIPVGVVITPAMIEHFNLDTAKGIGYAVLAWFGTALLAGLASALKSTAAGMPEVELMKEVEPTEYEDTEPMACDKEAE